MGNTGYTETSTTSTLFRVLGIATAVGSIAIATTIALVPPSPGKEPSMSDLVISSVALVVVAGLGTVLATTRLTVALDDRLSVRLTPFWYRRTIDPRTITSASPIALRGTDVGGWGVRFGPGRGTVVLMDNGPGVRLSITGKRDLSFRCGDPERLIAALAGRGATITSTATRTEHR